VKLLTVFAALMVPLLAALQAETPAQFPILIWYGPPPAANVRDDLEHIKQAGFNRCLFTAKDSQLNQQLLSDADEFGLQLYLSDAAIDDFCSGQNNSLRRLDSLTLIYSRFHSFRGFLLFDKPALADLKSFAELADFFSGKYPKLESFIQAQPLYATPARLDTTDYEAYLSILVRKLRPKLISVEHAGIVNTTLRAEFFRNLSIMRQLSLDNQTPFWAFVLLDPIGQPPIVPRSYIRVQAYSGLAFGAKGVQYYFFRSPGNLSPFANASVVDSDDRLSGTYANCKTVNMELAKLAPLLMDLTSIGVYAGKPTPAGVASLPPNLPITKVDAPDMVIGLFRDSQNAEYVMLVNTDFRLGKRCRVYFAPDVQGLAEISKNNAPPYTIQRESQETDDFADLLFKAGDGRLFQILK
jgi:hypothetical protein